MRKIERENLILLNKILAQRPHIPASTVKNDMQRKKSASCLSSAAINRRQQEERICIANNILRKKIEKISKRNTK